MSWASSRINLFFAIRQKKSQSGFPVIFSDISQKLLWGCTTYSLIVSWCIHHLTCLEIPREIPSWNLPDVSKNFPPGIYTGYYLKVYEGVLWKHAKGFLSGNRPETWNLWEYHEESFRDSHSFFFFRNSLTDSFGNIFKYYPENFFSFSWITSGISLWISSKFPPGISLKK